MFTAWENVGFFLYQYLLTYTDEEPTEIPFVLSVFHCEDGGFDMELKLTGASVGILYVSLRPGRNSSVSVLISGGRSSCLVLTRLL